MTARAHKDLRYENLTCVCDTREQLPLDLAPLKIVQGTLATGDYSVLGLEHLVSVERKSLEDLVMCVGRERDRFERELQRLLAYPSRLLVVESTLAEIELGQWRSQVAPAHVVGSLMAWMSMGIPVFFSGGHATAGKYVAKFLYVAARHRWRELQSFYENLKLAPSA